VIALKRKIDQVSGSQIGFLAPRAKAARPTTAMPKVAVAAATPRPFLARTPTQPATRPPVQVPKAKAAPTPVSSVEAARKGVKSEKNDNIKSAVKIRKLEVLSKQLLDEWSTLPKEKKEEGISLVATRFAQRISPEYLAQMAEKFIDAGAAGGSGDAEEAAAAKEDKPAPEEKEENGEAAEGEEAAEENAADFAEAMKELLQKAESEPATEWIQAWSILGISGNEQHTAALTALLEAALQGIAPLELAASLTVELARSKCVEMRSVELSLQAIARRLEDFIQADESAWHLLSHELTLLFPKTPSSTWGFQRQGWNWTTWWNLTEKVLNTADNFRAFDILVMLLQTCQEKSDAVIKKQQAWNDAGRKAKVQKALCTYSEMDTASIVETLAAYGVEL